MNHFAKMCKNENKAVYDMQCGELFMGKLSEVNDVTVSNDEWHVILHIEDKAVKLKLDSGAKCNVLR